MKVYHNSFSDKRIKKFGFSKLGENTWGNASNFLYAFSSLIGPWFSSEKLEAYDFAHEYDIEDEDFMIVEDNERLISILCDRLSKYDLPADEIDLLEREYLNKCRKIAKEIRNEFLDETYTGLWIKNDLEFGGESWIVFDTTKIKGCK